MVTIRPATGVNIATQVKKAGEEVKATLPSVEKEGTKLPSFQAPIIKNTRFDKVIVEGNIKERIEKLNILDGDKELDKLLKQYRADVDKCKLASSYKEYRRSVNLVEKKWHSLFEKIEDLSMSEDEAVAAKAGAVFENKFMPAILYMQEMFSKMDNTEMVRKAYFK